MSSLFYLTRRFKTATALNLLGLTVAFAAFYLFMTQVLYNAGYNRGIPDAERLFRVEAKMNLDAPWDVNCNRPVLEMMMQLPEVEAGTILPRWGSMQEVYQGETPVECAAEKIHGECGHHKRGDSGGNSNPQPATRGFDFAMRCYQRHKLTLVW